MLADILNELKTDMDLFDATGYTPKSLKEILSDNAKKAKYAGETDADDIRETPETPVSKMGDLYICGDHRLLVGDSNDPKNYERLLQCVKANMCFTDPPYKVN